jgi:hypothetical protein
MLMKDLFNEVIRRLEWSKERNLQPIISKVSTGYQVKIPVDKSVAYVIRIQEVAEKGALINSFFPDGDPHHCMGIPGVSAEQAAALIDAAALIVYGRLLDRQEDKK